MKKHIPNLISFANVASGFVSMIFLIEREFIPAMWWMFLAIIFDSVDGLVAAKLNVKNEMGKTVDMLADVVSFAVLPGIALYLFFAWSPVDGILVRIAAWTAGIGYTLAGLMREVRFGTHQADRKRSEGFVGLAIAPPAGFTVASIALINLSPALYSNFTLFLVYFFAAFHAYLMVRSNVIFYRWGKRGISWQFGVSLVLGVSAFFALGSYGMSLAIFFVFVCAIYIYFHVISAFFAGTLKNR